MNNKTLDKSVEGLSDLLEFKVQIAEARRSFNNFEYKVKIAEARRSYIRYRGE